MSNDDSMYTFNELDAEHTFLVWDTMPAQSPTGPSTGGPLDSNVTHELLGSVFPILKDPESIQEGSSLEDNHEEIFEKLRKIMRNIRVDNFLSLRWKSGNKDNTDQLANLRPHEVGFAEKLIFFKIKGIIQHKIVPDFLARFRFDEINTDFDGFKVFRDAIVNLYLDLSVFATHIEDLRRLRTRTKGHSFILGVKGLNESFRVCISTILFPQMTSKHSNVVEQFYSVCYDTFQGPSSGNFVRHEGRGLETADCQREEIVRSFDDVNTKLITLQLLQRMVNLPIMSLLGKKIEHHVMTTCKGNFHTSFVPSLEIWFKDQVMGWLDRVYVPKLVQPHSFHDMMMLLLYNLYTSLRIDEGFDIIARYPDSYFAVEDLRVCLERFDLRVDHVVTSLLTAVQTRLLLADISTSNILKTYVMIVVALRHLDPTGVVLTAVKQPIRQYLNQRNDTMQCTLAILKEAEASDLVEQQQLEEMVGGRQPPSRDADSAVLDSVGADPVNSLREDVVGVNAGGGDLGDLGAVGADPDYVAAGGAGPDDVAAGGGNPFEGGLSKFYDLQKLRESGEPIIVDRHSNRIISMLVTLYGSEEAFVGKYLDSLADRLLVDHNFNLEWELQQIDLLKRRFGESELEIWSVMLGDVLRSNFMNLPRRVDNGQLAQGGVLVISRRTVGQPGVVHRT